MPETPGAPWSATSEDVIVTGRPGEASTLLRGVRPPQ